MFPSTWCFVPRTNFSFQLYWAHCPCLIIKISISVLVNTHYSLLLSCSKAESLSQMSTRRPAQTGSWYSNALFAWQAQPQQLSWTHNKLHRALQPFWGSKQFTQQGLSGRYRQTASEVNRKVPLLYFKWVPLQFHQLTKCNLIPVKKGAQSYGIWMLTAYRGLVWYGLKADCTLAVVKKTCAG